MSMQHPAYWLAYLSENVETGPTEITAVAPEILPRDRFTNDAAMLLAAADAYHDRHPKERVVFAAAVTRWLSATGLTWRDLNVNFDNALRDLDRHAPALLIAASSIATAIVANANHHLNILVPGGRVETAEQHTEPVRAAILATLQRDWPNYIRGVVERVSGPSS